MDLYFTTAVVTAIGEVVTRTEWVATTIRLVTAKMVVIEEVEILNSR